MSTVQTLTLGTFVSLITFGNLVNGQTIEEASALYGRKQFDSALVVARNIIAGDNSAVDAYVLAGRVLVAKKNYNDAVEYLEHASTYSHAPAYAKAWALYELASCYFSRGDYRKAKKSLADCLRLNATKNVTSAANFLMLTLGFDKYYDTWIVKETTHFIFHFQDTTAIANLSAFVRRKEAAYDSINNFFKASLPKKIDYFVWINSQLAESKFNRGLAFSDAGLCITHTEPSHTIGHEMTHSISFHAVRPIRANRLIAEGVCVCFDLSNRNNIAELKTENKNPVSITEIWKSEIRLREEVVYPLGGELVKQLIETAGREKFIQLLADQSYENAKRIYGDRLDQIIDNIQGEINQ